MEVEEEKDGLFIVNDGLVIASKGIIIHIIKDFVAVKMMDRCLDNGSDVIHLSLGIFPNDCLEIGKIIILSLWERPNETRYWKIDRDEESIQKGISLFHKLSELSKSIYNTKNFTWIPSAYWNWEECQFYIPHGVIFQCQNDIDTAIVKLRQRGLGNIVMILNYLKTKNFNEHGILIYKTEEFFIDCKMY